ncbi:MAG: hypothetical protein ABJN26_21250 [Stappiaceae bacterium]
MSCGQENGVRPSSSRPLTLKSGLGKVLVSCLALPFVMISIKADASDPNNRNNQTDTIVVAQAGSGFFQSNFWSLPTASAKQSPPVQVVADTDIPQARLIASENFYAEAGQAVELAMTVIPPDKVDGGYVVIRGLPAEAKLSSGQRVGQGEVWVLGTKDLVNLRLMPLESAKEKLELSLELISSQGFTLDRRDIAVVIGEVKAPAPTANLAANKVAGIGDAATLVPKSDTSGGISASRTVTTKKVSLPKKQQTPKISDERRQKLFKRGEQMLEAGDIASARAFFERLANSGVAEGALAMGNTFDPNYLRTLNVMGLKGDIAKARQWYEYAAKLGSPQGAQLLEQLGQQ